MPKILLHHIDVINNEFVTGWCFNRLLPRVPVTIHFYIDDQPIGKVCCQRDRKDVYRSGMHPTGKCGFQFRFERKFSHTGNQTLFVRAFGRSALVKAIPLKEISPVLKLPRPFCFMHIPKTAGTSFNNHLQNWFGIEQWHSHIEVLTLDEQRLLARPGHYIAGHLPLFKFRQVVEFDQQTPLHTIVRSPLHQLHSHLAWIKGIGSQPDSAFFQQHPAVVQQLANQLQHLDLSSAEGISLFVQQMEGFQLDFFDNLQTRYFLGYRPEQVNKEDLRQAITNTDIFTSIGITENYDQYLLQCADLYNRTMHSQQTTKHNPATVDPLFDIENPEIYSALMPLMRFDLEIYEHIVNSR